MRYIISMIVCGLFFTTPMFSQRIQSTNRTQPVKTDTDISIDTSIGAPVGTSTTSGTVSPRQVTPTPVRAEQQPESKADTTSTPLPMRISSSTPTATLGPKRAANPTPIATPAAKAALGKKATAEDIARDVVPRDRVILKNALNDYKSITWARDIYRIIDIENGSNAAFFYPEETDSYQVNLFSLLFNLVKDERVEAYKFNLQNKIGKNEMEAIKLRDVLDLHIIPYTVGAGNKVNVSTYDLPTDEIRSYYIREKWIFDERTGKGDVRIVAICPVLHRPESYEFSDSPILKIPLFWISFDDVSQYLVRAVNYTAVSDVSKFSPNLSLFDILRNRFYDGDIYQIGDRVLAQFFETPEAMETEQKRVDKELNAIQNRFNNIR